MKNEVFAHFAKILDDLIDTYDFYKCYFQEPYSADYVPEVADLEFVCGASRGCLIDFTYDWVIKWDCEEDSLGGSCCEREIENYKDACACGLGDMFAEAHYIGTYTKTIDFWDVTEVRELMGYDDDDDTKYWQEKIAENLTNPYSITIRVPLYAYRRADDNCDTVEDKCSAGEHEEFFKNSTSPLCERSFRIGEGFAQEYGLEAFEELTEFCAEHRINDIHWGNIGIIDERLVLIDYSGYWSHEA